jgi:protein TonB
MAALPLAGVRPAHQVFKLQHNRRLLWAAVGALAVLTLLVLVMPEYRPTPYRLTTNELIIDDYEIEAIEAPPPDRPQRQVRVPVIEPSSDPDARDTIPDIPIVDIPLPVPDVPALPSDTPFVAAYEKPRLIQGARADYPEMARLAGLQGLVMVKVLVDVDGSIARVELLKGVHPLIDRPALAAAKRLRFAPGTQRSMPVPCWVAVPFRFSLD